MIYTIGYQGLPLTQFLQILADKRIDVLIDVRSKPYGRAVSYNRKALEELFAKLGKRYIYKGDVLGGFTPIYPPAIEWLADRICDTGVNHLILCFEKNPAECHRHYELGRRLLARDIDIMHLSYNGLNMWASEIKP